MAPSSSPTSIAGRAQQKPRAQIPVLDTTSGTRPASSPPAPHKIPYLEDGVQKDANYQVHWRNWMSGGKQKSFYKHVFVLLLSWHPDCDDMKVDPEVQRLRAVFKDIYNYHVESTQLDCRLSALPQAQANLAVANFVHRNDRDDALFIVYYAGHGSPGKKRGPLNLAGRRRQDGKRAAQEFSYVTWNLVESNLWAARADVLLIFDCCHSSDLGRGSDLNSRSFEYLAASTTPYTSSPGEQSFTSALIWALEKLADPSSREVSQGSPIFTTSKLAKKISECPDFPKEQNPSLTTRDIEAWQHIILAPLPLRSASARTPTPNSEAEDEDEDDKPVHQFISLNLHFKHKEDELELLKKLADHLKKFMKLEPSLQKVQLGGIWSGLTPSPRHRWRVLLRKLKMMCQGASPVSRSQDSILPPDNIQGDRLSPQPGYLLPFPSTERTHLLSDASSVTFEEQEEARASSFWSGIFSFFRSFRKSTLAEPQVQPAGTASIVAKKPSTRWTHRLANGLRRFFVRPLPRIQILW